MKLKPEQVKDLIDDIENTLKANRDVIESDPRISKPFHATEAAVKMKYEHLQEKPPVDGSQL